MIQDPHQDDFFFKLRVLSQRGRDEDAPLAVRAALKGAADKHPSEAAHVIIFLRHGQYLSFYFTPFTEGKTHQAAVHLGDHQAFAAVGFDHIFEPGRNDNAPLGVYGMK